MADLKISQLTGATTPLAGTEVLPIVQSGSTKKVSVADLTTGRTVNMLKGVFTNSGSANSSADFTNTIFQDVLVNLFTASGTTGNKVTVQFGDNGGATSTSNIIAYNSAYGGGLNNAIQFGNANGAVRVTTAGDALLTTGNLIQGTAAKGINFTANTPAAGMTSQLLNWYEEGTWTPTVKGGTTAGTYEIGTNGCTYTRIGRQVTLNVYIQMAGTVTGGGSGDLQITGVPYAKAANANPVAAVYLALGTFTGNAPTASWNSFSSSSILILNQVASGGYGTTIPISYASANAYITFTMIYFV